jgi:hypothetical protein
VFQKELYNSIANVAVWRVLRKSLLLKAYKLSIFQGEHGNDPMGFRKKKEINVLAN